MTDFHEEDALGKAYDARLMRRLLRYLKPYRWHVALALVILLFGSAMAVVGPWITARVIDEAIPAGDTRLLWVLIAVYLAALVLEFVLQYAQALITTWLGQSVMYDLRQEIFAKLQRLDLRFYDRNPIGRLMTRITNDVETLNTLFSSGVVTVFGDLFTLGFIVAAMLSMSWPLALVSFSILPVVFLTAFVFRAKVRAAYRDIRVRIARINAFLQEHITGVQVVQLFNREAADAERLAQLNDSHLRAHLRSITYYALFFPAIQLFTAVALALIIWYGGARMLDGYVSVGVIVAFLQWARRFYRPIQDLSEKYNLLQAAMASSERVFQLLDEEIDVGEPDDPAKLPAEGRGSITFEGVWFAYGRTDGGEPDWVLRDVSFRVAPGEKVAIVGHTGAGKTTIINLLMRFYDTQKGASCSMACRSTRFRSTPCAAASGWCCRTSSSSAHDVAYNIRLGSPEISEERIHDAAERIGAADFIERLEDGYAQELGERGSTLSVGERQLVSFARALAFDPAILVLDEATSSVDSEIEEKIEIATDELLEGRTSLVIAHRLSTIQNADRILVMHHGRLHEEGTHDELLAANGLYARLHALQFAAVAAD